MKIRFSDEILKEMELHNITTKQIINCLYIDKRYIDNLEFAVNKNVDGTVVVDSLSSDDIDLFGSTGKIVEVDDFEV